MLDSVDSKGGFSLLKFPLHVTVLPIADLSLLILQKLLTKLDDICSQGRGCVKQCGNWAQQSLFLEEGQVDFFFTKKPNTFSFAFH